MCGICGIATRGATPDAAVLHRMTSTIVHRGPDGEGAWIAPGIALGMRRLAIIDLVTGQQPMGNETGDVQVVFNGEIYEHDVLRRELERAGHRFRTKSDTEVIPHLYETHGLDFLSRMNGIFAIALWDARRRRLLLARDRCGVKPLLWSLCRDTLYFGSEMKCLLAAGATERRLDPVALDELLTFEYTASPRTLLADVHKLPPGGWLTWQEGRIETGSFFSFPDANASGLEEGDVAGWTRRLRATLDAAVARQMVSDVPLGAFLSGGIDSSILVSAMTRASTHPVKTFSIGFADHSYDELRHARTVARHLGTDHHEAVLEPSSIDLVPRVIHHLDQPIADFSVFPTLLVSELARRHVTVSLSGDGGDELFAGYDTLAADRAVHATLDRLPRIVRQALLAIARCIPGSHAKKGLVNVAKRVLEGAALPAELGHARWMVFLSPAQRRSLHTPALLATVGDAAERTLLGYLDNGGRDRIDRALRCDVRFYLAENILPKVDLMSMATSLEARVPYLDDKVTQLAFGMPSSLKLRGGVRKWILRRAYADALPREILARGKEGFSIPMKRWLVGEWRPLLRDLLSPDALARDGLFVPATVSRWIAEHESGRADHAHVLWALLVFHLWKRAFLDAPVPQGATGPAASRPPRVAGTGTAPAAQGIS